MFLRLLMTGWLLISGNAFATERPIEEKARIGLDVGIQKEVILSRIDAQPINFNNNDIQPPLITVQGLNLVPCIPCEQMSRSKPYI